MYNHAMIYGVSVYIYRITSDYGYKTSITGREFENEWFNLKKDGHVTVKGSNGRGYAWDGASPKIKVLDVYFGTPEAVLNFGNGQSKTYYASLIHDVFYQFSKDLKGLVARKEADEQLYAVLKRDDFRLAKLYYLAVRALGWIYWKK
ncbi:MAG: hypothetical protein HQL30_06190 [Candidatus Omnitrophica bacterium]|nr:hypothetical protein [Candidatus Omnitrophota bacterium]